MRKKHDLVETFRKAFVRDRNWHVSVYDVRCKNCNYTKVRQDKRRTTPRERAEWDRNH